MQNSEVKAGQDNPKNGETHGRTYLHAIIFGAAILLTVGGYFFGYRFFRYSCDDEVTALWLLAVFAALFIRRIYSWLVEFTRMMLERPVLLILPGGLFAGAVGLALYGSWQQNVRSESDSKAQYAAMAKIQNQWRSRNIYLPEVIDFKLINTAKIEALYSQISPLNLKERTETNSAGTIERISVSAPKVPVAVEYKQNGNQEVTQKFEVQTSISAKARAVIDRLQQGVIDVTNLTIYSPSLAQFISFEYFARSRKITFDKIQFSKLKRDAFAKAKASTIDEFKKTKGYFYIRAAFNVSNNGEHFVLRTAKKVYESEHERRSARDVFDTALYAPELDCPRSPLCQYDQIEFLSTAISPRSATINSAIFTQKGLEVVAPELAVFGEIVEASYDGRFVLLFEPYAVW